MNNYGRVRSQAFSVDSHPSSIQEPVFSNRKAFTKERLSLQKSRRHIVPRFFPASLVGAGFGRQLRQNAPRQKEKTPPIRDLHFWKKEEFPAGSTLRLRLLLRPETLQNRGGGRTTAGRAARFAAVADFEDFEEFAEFDEFNEFERAPRGERGERFEFDGSDGSDGSDGRGERRRVTWTGETVEGVPHGGFGEPAAEGDAAEAGDRAVSGNRETDAGGAGPFARGASKEPERTVASGERESQQPEIDVGAAERMDGREKGLLERKRQQENQLTENLLSHYRSTVEDQVTDVQRRVEGERKE